MVSVKAFLAFMAMSGVITPKCAAFVGPAHSSKSVTRTISTTRLDPLQAFKFPSFENGGRAEIIEEVSSSSDTPLALFEPITDVCILALRLATCTLMIHHGFDKIQNVDGFSLNVVAKFFGFLPGDPSFWTLSAAGTQVVGSVLLALGILSRPVAFSMMMTMAVAVIFHLLNTGVEGFPLAVVSQHSYNYELAAMYVGVLAYFSASGAGRYSFDEKVLGGELQLYDKALGKLFNSNNDANDESQKIDEKVTFKMPW